MGSKFVDWKSPLIRGHSGESRNPGGSKLDRNEPGCRRSPAWQTFTSVQGWPSPV